MLVCMCVCVLVCLCVFVSVCVASVIQLARHMRRVTLSSVTCLAVPYFSTLTHKRHDFCKKKKLLKVNCVLIFSTNFVLEIPHCK